MTTAAMIHVHAHEDIKAPNTKTRAATAEAEEITHTHHARFANAADLFDDLEKSHSKSTRRTFGLD